MPGSSWADYDRGCISAGGGVYSRRLKSISLGPEVRRVLGTNAERATPAELIRLMLCAPVDLIWNGGIGTYIKSDVEQNSDVGDKSNDELRVNSSQLRCKVIGEGGNLGITQRGRVAFAEAGGHVNADWIDNSGGVHCSDREVNIKILLNPAVAAGKISPGDRNRLLRAMTRDVSALVLLDNYRQARAITAAQRESLNRLEWYVQLLDVLDRQEDFSREQERLPENATLEKRRAAQAGLSRPEIAVLLAHTKRAIYQDILQSTLPDQPYMKGILERYFPEQLREPFAAELEQHQLRREIIATVATNSMVNRAGLIFAHRLADETGARIADVSTAYLLARDVFDMRRLWSQVDALDNKVAVEVQMHMIYETQHLLRHAARWYLRHDSFLADVAGTVDTFRHGADVVRKLVPEFLGDEEWSYFAGEVAKLVEQGVPPRLAQEFGTLRALAGALEVTLLARNEGKPLPFVARCFYRLGTFLRMQRIDQLVSSLKSETTWRDRARTDLVQGFHAILAFLTSDALALDGASGSPAELIKMWHERNAEPCGHYLDVLDDLQYESRIELAMLSVLAGKLRGLRRSGAQI